jgi:hypothetical protein
MGRSGATAFSGFQPRSTLSTHSTTSSGLYETRLPVAPGREASFDSVEDVPKAGLNLGLGKDGFESRHLGEDLVDMDDTSVTAGYRAES